VNRQACYGLLTCCAVALSACSDSTVIGDEGCPQDVTCKKQALSSSGEIVQVGTAAPTAITPSWTKNDELGLASAGASAFASGRDGGLWLFKAVGEQLTASQLDANGKLLGQQTIPVPADLGMVAGLPVVLKLAATSHEQGPVLAVQWNESCGPDGSPPGVSALCPRVEALVFGRTFDAQARRINGLTPPQNSMIPAIYRSAAGDTLWVSRLPTDIMMVDLAGNVLWRKEPPDKLLGEDMPSQLSANYNPPSAVGGLAPDGSLRVTASRLLFDGDTTWNPTSGLLLSYDLTGQLTVESYLSDDLPFLVRAPSWTAVPGTNSAMAYDATGRLSLAAQLVGGDLAVMRMQGAQLETFQILREDYADLFLGPTTMDAGGTFYLTTLAGGRDPAEQKPLLCRIPGAGTPSCLALPRRPFNVLATTAGVLYELSEDGLSRFDLPPT
jgi:hypothetical protein